MSNPPAQHRPSSWGRTLGIGAALAIVVTIVLLAFSWPAVTSTISGLPVAVVGPSQQVEAVETALDERQPDVFVFTEAPDRDAAVAMIERREAYGAIVLGQSPEVLTASAASTVVSAALGQVATGVQAQLDAAAGPAAPRVAVTDVVALSGNDPRGMGLASASFPLTMGGMIGGIAASLFVVGTRRRLVAVGVYAAFAGLALAGVLQGWFGALQGPFALNAGAIAVTILAMSAPIVGIVGLVGRAGIAFGPVVFLFFANPISAATAPLESLPGRWGSIGQLFPPGAGATLLRDLSYFPNASTLPQAWLVVSIWAAAGVLLIAVGGVVQASQRRRIAAAAVPDGESGVSGASISAAAAASSAATASSDSLGESADVLGGEVAGDPVPVGV